MLKAPWLKFYENVPAHLDYPDISMYDFVERTARKYPNIGYNLWGLKLPILS